MKMKLIMGKFNSFVAIILLICVVETCDAELRLLMSIFRHGDRYPMSYRFTRFIYPRNPHANVSWFPDSDEGLTADGKRNAYEFGNILREKYVSWLGSNYSKKLFDFRSSYASRTAMTASLVAAALFPPIDGQRWNGKLNWQPIPVSKIPAENDVLHFGGVLCTNYNLKYLETKLTDRFIINYDLAMGPFYRYVSRHTGAPVTSKILNYLHMEFLALMSGGLDLPEWTNDIRENITEAAITEYLFSSWNDELKRLTGGPWLKEWLDHVNDYLNIEESTPKGSTIKNNNKTTKKAFFYGGHDINVAGILITLGIYYRHVPNYVSAVNFELHEDDNRQFYVKVLHRDLDKFVEYLVPGCKDILCPLDTFRTIFARCIPKNLTEECGSYINNVIM